MREIPKEQYFVDENFRAIALRNYNEQELIDLGCVQTATGHYLLLSSDQLMGVDLVFERKEAGVWGITKENRGVLFDSSLGYEEFLEKLRKLIDDARERNSVDADLENRLEELRGLL